MKIKKINLDRKPISSEYIQKKQDFQQLMTIYRKQTIPVWKQPLFYGVIGLASITTVVVTYLIPINPTPIEKKITSKNEIIPTISSADNELFTVVSTESVGRDEKIQNNEPSQKRKSEASEVQIIDLDQPIEGLTYEGSVSEKRVDRKTGFLPSVSGFSQGDIPLDMLCNSEGIIVGDGTEIKSFKVFYSVGMSEKTQIVSGNKIPDGVCVDLKKSGFDQMLFITEIAGVKESKSVNVPSMNLWIIIG